MFTDNSLWLAMVLAHHNAAFKENALVLPSRLMFNIWHYFLPGGAKTNSTMHHFLRIANNSSPSSSSS